MKVLIMTTPTCGVCKMLDMMLSSDDELGEVSDKIEWVKQEEDPKRFKTIMDSVKSTTVPTLIFLEGTEVKDTLINQPVGLARARIKKYLLEL